MNYQKIAREIVLNYVNKHIDKTDNVQIVKIS
nr:MAG TPA: DegQ (SacQ) family [Caudoviricetes sp.]